MAGRTLVVVNPRSRSGATGRRWDAVHARLREALGDVEVERTRGPRDAERIAREGVRAGVELLVVAGGDGTLSEVVTGLLGADLGGYAEIALLPLGTGGDFARTLGLPRGLDAALEVIAHGRPRRIDAGRVTFAGEGGTRRTTYFANAASFGISGLIVELVNRTSKAFGGRASFLAGTLRGIARYRPVPVSVRVDGALAHEGPLVLGAAASGRYFGGGMCVAPEAQPDDGLLDVVIVRGLPKPRLVAKLPSIYSGQHLRDPATTFLRGRKVEAEVAPGHGPVRLDVDGEPLGILPVRIELLPGALSIRGPAR